MSAVFKYNATPRYSTEDLKRGYSNNSFSLLDVYLDEKGPSVRIQLSNIFKNHHLIAKPSPMKVGYGEWLLSIAFWRKFYHNHGKYKSN